MTERALRRQSEDVVLAAGSTQAASQPVVLDVDAVYRAEAAYVWRTLQRLGMPARDSEDLLHEVFVVVHRRLVDYDRARPIRPWLFGIAVRVAAKHRRRIHDCELVADAIDPGALPDEQLAAEQTRRVVLQLLQCLDFDRRAVLVMSDIDGCSAPEIAAALQIPLNTVYSRLRSARQRFAAAARRLRTSERGDP